MSEWTQTSIETPAGWSSDCLGNVATLQRGFDLPIQDRAEGKVPVYGSNGIDGFHAHSMLHGPGVITGRSGTIGLVHYEQGEYWPLNTTLYVKDFHGNAPRYIYYFLQTLDLKRFAAATGVPSLNRNFVHPLPVIAPPPPEQRKIARILTTLDELIEKTEALIAKYQAVKQGMMHDLFTRGVDEHGHLRPTYDEAPELYKESELGWIPKDWEVERVDDHLERIEQGWSPDCDSEPATSGEWGVLKTTAVVWEGFNWQENKRLPKHLSPDTQYEVHVDDVLMTRGGPNSRVGVVAIVRETRERLMLSDKIYRLVPRKSVLPRYLALALSSDRTQTHLSTLKTGLAESQTNISQAIVRRLWIGIPNKEEQEQSCQRIDAFDLVLQSQRKSLAAYRVQKTGLMQDLLTGTVRVKPDEGGDDV